MNVVSVHGGLVHIILSVASVNAQGVTALIANSPKLMKCHINTRFKQLSEDDRFNVRDFVLALKKRFPNRKLFSCGSLSLTQGKTYLTYNALNDFLMEHNTDLTSLWSSLI